VDIPAPPNARVRIPCAALLAALLATGAVLAQEPQAPPEPNADLPPITFRTEVSLVEVDAFVTDAAGRFVPNLTQADFELLEDGEPQAIETFSAVNLPIETAERPLFSARPIEPDVRSNETREGRIYLILLDDVHVHPTRIPRVRAALRQFVERSFGTNDLAAVVRVRGGSDDSQGFTNSPERLMRAIDRFTGNVPNEAPIAQLSGTGASAADLQSAWDARQVSGRLRELSEYLASVRGRRKSLLFVSEGSSFNIYDGVGQIGTVASIVREDTQKAIAAATRGNVTIYPIDPRGLVTFDPNDFAGEAPPSNVGLRLSQDSLRELAEGTGGFASVNVNDMSRAFERIVSENSAYYVLGYSPSNDRRDGKFRRLQVRIKRPGLTVRSRAGYTAATGRDTTRQRAATATFPAVATALSSPLPTSGVPIRVFAAPYRGNGKDAFVATVVEVDASAFDFVEKNGAFVERLEVLQTTTNADGKTFSPLRHDVGLTLKPENYERARSGGIRVVARMTVPPGRYQLHVAAGAASGRAGGVVYDLDVPDFTKERLVMSGLSLASVSGGEMITVATKESLPTPLKYPMSTARTFGSDDVVSVFGEVYENVRGGPVRSVEISTELRTDAGRVVFRTSDMRSSTELKGASGGGYGFTADIPLKNLEPGIYVVHSEARSNIGDRPAVSRDVQIRIR
jgi:VWFA-related protein